MSTYLRRMLVPKEHLAPVISQIQANYTQQILIDMTNIGGVEYGIIKAISDKPLVAWVNRTLTTNIEDAPSAGTLLLARAYLYASDLDLKASITEDSTTVHGEGAFDELGWSAFTYTITDADGSTATVEVPVLVVDDVSPVITAAATATPTNAECLAGTWVPTATANDTGDGNITEDIVITYFQANGTTAIASLALFNTYLCNNGDGGLGGKVKFNVTDAAGNAATQVIQTVTAGADITPPVITLTATAVNIALADIAAWNETTNVASAVDDIDGDVKTDVMYTFHKFDGDVQGDAIASLADAKTWLGTAGHKVRVSYNVSDDHSNAATTKYCVYTSIE